MHRHALRDDQWLKIKDFLPGREGQVGGTAANNRLFVDSVIFRYRYGVASQGLARKPAAKCFGVLGAGTSEGSAAGVAARPFPGSVAG
jgi:hypothetical protein